MATYDFYCHKCDSQFEIISSPKRYDPLSACPKCGIVGERIWSPPVIYGTKVEDREYNPGLGIVTKNAKHRRDEARARGLEEVGNDYGAGNKMQEHFDKIREEKKKKSWDDL